MTITPTDADIAEALRLSGYHASFFDLSKIDVGATWGGAIRAHAQTIAKLRVAVDALEAVNASRRGADAAMYYSECQWVAGQALAQIKGTDQ